MTHKAELTNINIEDRNRFIEEIDTEVIKSVSNLTTGKLLDLINTNGLYIKESPVDVLFSRGSYLKKSIASYIL